MLCINNGCHKCPDKACKTVSRETFTPTPLQQELSETIRAIIKNAYITGHMDRLTRTIKGEQEIINEAFRRTREEHNHAAGR